MIVGWNWRRLWCCRRVRREFLLMVRDPFMFFVARVVRLEL